MYIIAIAWLYVTVLMAATEPNITAGILTFTCYGLIPCALFLWLLGTKHRHHQRNIKQDNNAKLLDKNMDQQDSPHTKTNQ